MSTHNICIHVGIRKISVLFGWKKTQNKTNALSSKSLELWGTMTIILYYVAGLGKKMTDSVMKILSSR